MNEKLYAQLRKHLEDQRVDFPPTESGAEIDIRVEPSLILTHEWRRNGIKSGIMD